MSRVVLIDNYDSFTYNLFQYVQSLVEAPITVLRNDAADIDGIRALQPTHIILSPGPGHPAVDGDFGVCKDIILEKESLDAAVLGVCLGHQGIVHYLGGEVVRAPQIVHGKTSSVRVTAPSALFEGLSDPFTAMRYHSLVAAENAFPDALTVTARTTDAPNLIMAAENAARRLYGIQFHPESIGTPEGLAMLGNFVSRC